MQRLTKIVGSMSDLELAQRLQDLGNVGGVEYILLAGEDRQRRRFHVKTDQGTDCAVMLPRSAELSDGTILMLEEKRAIVVRIAEETWLDLVPRDATAALELGYFAGNMHWPVRFEGEMLRIALQGPEQEYMTRMVHLFTDGRVRRAVRVG